MKEKLEPVEGEIKSKAGRPPRKSLRHTGKMKVPHIPGYYLRFINTSEKTHPTRLQDCKDAWYEPVLRKEVYGEGCERPNEIVTVADPACPMLVKLPLDIREEDMKAKEILNNEAVEQAKGNKLQNEYGQVTITRS